MCCNIITIGIIIFMKLHLKEIYWVRWILFIAIIYLAILSKFHVLYHNSLSVTMVFLSSIVTKISFAILLAFFHWFNSAMLSALFLSLTNIPSINSKASWASKIAHTWNFHCIQLLESISFSIFALSVSILSSANKQSGKMADSRPRMLEQHRVDKRR